MYYTAPETQPTKKSLEVAAGLAKANMLMRLPLLRVVETCSKDLFKGTPPNQGDCLRHVLKEILRNPVMLSKFHFQGYMYSFNNWTCFITF